MKQRFDWGTLLFVSGALLFLVGLSLPSRAAFILGALFLGIALRYFRKEGPLLSRELTWSGLTVAILPAKELVPDSASARLIQALRETLLLANAKVEIISKVQAVTAWVEHGSQVFLEVGLDFYDPPAEVREERSLMVQFFVWSDGPHHLSTQGEVKRKIPRNEDIPPGFWNELASSILDRVEIRCHQGFLDISILPSEG